MTYNVFGGTLNPTHSLTHCPRGYLGNHTRDLYQFFVHAACGRGSLLLRHGDEIPRERGNILGFSFPLTVHCKLRVRCKRGHSISAGKGWWKCIAARAKC